MLVIASDLHLTDGSSGSTTSAAAFRIFANRLRELAVAASWRADGRYQPIERIDIVLLGDVLDAIRSSQWSAQPNVRPWGNPHSAEFVDQITRITSGILANNDEALQVLRGLSAEGGLTVPSIPKPAGPTAEDRGDPVDVRIHYMVGNHDWFYHLRGSKYDILRQQIILRMGLANLANEPFPHDIAESEELLATMRRHKVTARHGDAFDPMNFEGDRDTASLGDVIVIELLNRFAAEVETQLSAELPASTVHGLREIDNVRPLLLIPVWIDGLLERTCPFPSMRKQVKIVWDRLADEFLSIDFVRQRDTFSPFDLVDGLQKTLKFSKRLSIGWASSIMSWLNSVRGDSCQSYYRHALAEQDFRNRRSRHIVYGHTHVMENMALDASYAEGYVLNQEYFNAGTWRRVHRQTQLAPGEHEFIAQDVMSYLVFFQGDERKGRPYETWSATLGVNTSEIAVHRIDPGKPNHAQGQSVPAPGLSIHAPHFTALPAEPPTVSARWIE